MNNSNMKSCYCPCNVTPIVCPERVVCRHCTYCYAQPVIIPIRTHTINHYVPQYVYQTTYSSSEENICHGQQTNQVS